MQELKEKNKETLKKYCQNNGAMSKDTSKLPRGSFDLLPEKVLLKIFGFLTAKDLQAAEKLNHKSRKAITENNVWEHLYRRSYFLTDSIDSKLRRLTFKQKCMKLDNLSLYDGPLKKQEDNQQKICIQTESQRTQEINMINVAKSACIIS